MTSAALCSTRRSFATAPPDYYRVLGVSSTATNDEIKAAYKKLALELHPDRNKAKDAEERFKQVSEAYSVVGNKAKRQEYDTQRQMFSSTSAGGPGGRSYEDWANRGFAHSGQGGANVRTQSMSTADAEKIFRELFGNVNMEDIFREFDQSQKGNRTGLGEHVNFNRRFGSFDSSNGNASNFNRFFQQTATRTFQDESGNTRMETEFVDQFGHRHTVSRNTSTFENASTNTDPNEFMRSAANRDPFGRVHHASGYYTFGRRGDTNDFFQKYFGVRSHGRSPIVSLVILLCWAIIVGTLCFALASFLTKYPVFVMAVLVLLYLRRNSKYWKQG
jgi:curved DNA-binding protein CbpA